jgi:hypothetical protein
MPTPKEMILFRIHRILSHSVRLYPRHFVRFLDGRMGTIATIAFLPGDLGAWIGCLVTEVKITHEYALKVFRKHKLKYEDFSLIELAIERGWCICPKKNFLELLYCEDRIPGRWFVLVLKSAKGGSECWIVTLHRLDPLQARSKLRRARQAGTLIREYNEMTETE